MLLKCTLRSSASGGAFGCSPVAAGLQGSTAGTITATIGRGRVCASPESICEFLKHDVCFAGKGCFFPRTYVVVKYNWDAFTCTSTIHKKCSIFKKMYYTRKLLLWQRKISWEVLNTWFWSSFHTQGNHHCRWSRDPRKSNFHQQEQLENKPWVGNLCGAFYL